MKCLKQAGKTLFFFKKKKQSDTAKNNFFSLPVSSPLFCCLELVGFILAYVAAAMTIGIPSQVTCYVQPITISLGFMLVLGYITFLL